MINKIVALWTSSDINGSTATEGPLPVLALVFIGIAIFLAATSFAYLIMSDVAKKKERARIEKELKEEIEKYKQENK